MSKMGITSCNQMKIFNPLTRPGIKQEYLETVPSIYTTNLLQNDPQLKGNNVSLFCVWYDSRY